MSELLNGSREILQNAIEKFKPYAIVSMFSGGDDSLTAYHVLRELGCNPDYIVHGNTRTGIQQTTEFVRQFSRDEGIPLLEADAGTAYENYVLENGFFGRGLKAHTYSYHILKAGPLRKVISKHIRQGKRNRVVLMISGARISESENRKNNLTEPVDSDPSAKSNKWVNIIRYWQKADCLEFLQSIHAHRNPVTQTMNRSGECLCGTMQSPATRAEAAMLYPEWGKWLNDLERRVIDRHGYGWGVNVPKSLSLIRAGQKQFDFMPMCAGCKLEYANEIAPRPKARR